jgi:acyl-CoA thioester hydrolase
MSGSLLTVAVPLRWADIDANGHVNNVAMLRLLEEARIATFWPVPEEQIALGARESTGRLAVFAEGPAVHSVVASNHVEYLRELPYRYDPILVDLWVSALGGSSMTVDYRVRTGDDPEGERPYVTARTVLVAVDDETGTPVRFGPVQRDALRAHLREPLEFRR